MIEHNPIRVHGEIESFSVLDKIYNAVALYRPALFELLEQRGQARLDGYACSLFEGVAGVKSALADTIAQRCKRLFGEGVATAVHDQLLINGTIATADHHGICTHPILFQGDALAAYGAAKNGLRYLVVLATGNVPLNNASYPRGVIFDDQRYPLYPDSKKHALVYGLESFNCERLQRIPPALARIITEIDNLGSFNLFSDQVSLINHTLFKECLGPQMPDVITLQLEDVISDMLIDNAQSDLLLNLGLLGDAVTAFDGIAGAWSVDGSGSHLFWGRSSNGRAQRLRLNGSKLVADDYDIDLAKQEQMCKLEDRSILPGLLLSFAVLLENGATCLGGFNQIDYLTKMKARLQAFAECNHAHELAIQMQHISTDRFSTGPLVLLDQSGRVASTDRFLAQPITSRQRFQELLETVSLKRAALVGLREMYNTFVPITAHDKIVLATTLREVGKETGLIL